MEAEILISHDLGRVPKCFGYRLEQTFNDFHSFVTEQLTSSLPLNPETFKILKIVKESLRIVRLLESNKNENRYKSLMFL